ncbi:MAG: hypothetical protein JO322_10670 [Candidatus Eremiobacteraeota bacterium]|nr:hypothetical protein [Candidatus Eremiobacteraeota bacterium]
MKRAFLLAALIAPFFVAGLPARAQVLDRDIPTAGATTLRLNVSGSVRLIAADVSSVKLHVVDYGPKTPTMHVTTSKTGSRLSVSVTGPSQNALPFTGASGYELQITYPSSIKIDLREFAGPVHIDRVTAPMQIYNAEGSILVDDARSALTAESDRGDVTVSKAIGMVELTCGNGNANATLAPNWSGNLVRMESSQGNLTLNVPRTFRARFDVSSAQGTVNNPLPTTPHAPLVFMLTEQGNVVVNTSGSL